MASSQHRHHVGIGRVAAATALASLLLAGCGGGGSDTPAASGTTTPPGNSGTTPVVSGAATCNLPDFAASALARINQWRASGADCGAEGKFGPAPAVAWNDALTQAALGHSQDMVTNNFFSHTGTGSTLATRVSATGYAWRSVGENIAAGQTGIVQVVDGWIASEGHCANLLNPAFTELGLACVSGSNGNAYPTYWTLDLAQPR
jgi:uncharacterized protein YkwD